MSEAMAFQILSRLPPKSLMRFKCVRKSWYIMINSRCFIAKHLSSGMHNNAYTSLLLKRLIVRETDPHKKETVFSLLNICNDNDDGEHIHYVVEDMTKGQFIGLKVLECGWIVGHCDGIICLANSKKVIMLLNPAIMEIKLLPADPYVQDETLNFGFGYDPKSKTYKVVHIYGLPAETWGDQHMSLNHDAVKVYALGTDSWRQIMAESLETETTNFCPKAFQMYFKGFCYWTGCEELKEFVSVYDYGEEEYLRQVIILFDMGDEVFNNVLFPDTFYESDACWYDMRLIVWNESVILFGMDFGITDAESWGLWLMDDFGGSKSWIKQFTFANAVGIDAPLKFWKSYEPKILMVSPEGYIVSYNLDTEKLTYIPFHCMDSECYELAAYETSILSITENNVPRS